MRKKTASTPSISSTSASTKTVNNTRLICGNCGATIVIPDRETFLEGVRIIGKNSNAGTIVLETEGTAEPPKLSKKPKTATEKLEALKAAGIDVSNFFMMPGVDGLYKPHDGVIAKVDESDPVIKKILSAGDAPVYRLFRRWVMGQMFHMLSHTGGFQKALNNLGYYYQWKVVADEFHTQAVLWKKDKDCYRERHMWFNRDTLYFMICDFAKAYRKAAEKCVDGRSTNVMGRWMNMDEANFVLNKIDGFASNAVNCAKNGNEEYLSKIAKDVAAFIKEHTSGQNAKLHQSTAFQNAYKGAGGFFTMQNLIRFHKCRFIHPTTGKKMTENESLIELWKKATEVSKEASGYKMFGMLKEFLKANKINIAKKIASWHTDGNQK